MKGDVLVLGSTGLVGKNLSKVLKARYNVYEVSSKDFDLVNDIDSFRKNFSQMDFKYVYMCAAKVGGIKANMENPYEFLFDNLQMQNNVIESFRRNLRTEKFVFLGSSCIYPKDYIQPLKEEYLLKASLEPTNEAYALAKICGLKLCEYAKKKCEKIKFITLMPCNLYGPGDHFDLDKSHVLSSLVKKFVDAERGNKKEVVVWGSGKQKREFLYIDDLIDAVVWASETFDGNEGLVNIGVGRSITIKDLSEKIKLYTGFKGDIIYDISKAEGMMEKTLDISKAKKLGWVSKTNIDEGLVKIIEYYRGLE